MNIDPMVVLTFLLFALLAWMFWAERNQNKKR